jgi:hypothetical protein
VNVDFLERPEIGGHRQHLCEIAARDARDGDGRKVGRRGAGRAWAGTGRGESGRDNDSANRRRRTKQSIHVTRLTKLEPFGGALVTSGR